MFYGCFLIIKYNSETQTVNFNQLTFYIKLLNPEIF
jgi:hypothetical protein